MGEPVAGRRKVQRWCCTGVGRGCLVPSLWGLFQGEAAYAAWEALIWARR